MRTFSLSPKVACSTERVLLSKVYLLDFEDRCSGVNLRYLAFGDVFTRMRSNDS